MGFIPMIARKRYRRPELRPFWMLHSSTTIRIRSQSIARGGQFHGCFAPGFIARIDPPCLNAKSKIRNATEVDCSFEREHVIFTCTCFCKAFIA